MEKKQKKKLIIVIVAVAIILAIITIASFSVGPMLFMKPSETGEFSNTGIYILKNNINNIYLINSTDGYILIDTGSNVETVKEELKQSKINPSDIKHILITHTDYDHVDGLSYFKNATVYMSEDILQTNGTNKILFERNSLDGKIKVEDVTFLTDEELLIGGIKINSIKTPGHTPGHMIYLINDTFLFTGDSAEISENTLKIHPYTMDEKNANKSMKIIKDIIKKCSYVFTPHYGQYKAEKLI